MQQLYTDVVVDLETLGTKSGAVIVSIGAVSFNSHDTDNWETLDDEGRCFYAVLNLDEQVLAGHTIDPDTVLWWMKQDVMARKVYDEHKEGVAPVLTRFAEFCEGTKRLWGNGSSFDNVLLRALYDTYKLPFPYNFWNDMDLRTLKFASGIQKFDINQGLAHHALDDAKYEALCIQDCMRAFAGVA